MPRNEGTDHGQEKYKTPIDKIIKPRPVDSKKDENQSPYPEGGDPYDE